MKLQENTSRGNSKLHWTAWGNLKTVASSCYSKKRKEIGREQGTLETVAMAISCHSMKEIGELSRLWHDSHCATPWKKLENSRDCGMGHIMPLHERNWRTLETVAWVTLCHSMKEFGELSRLWHGPHHATPGKKLENSRDCGMRKIFHYIFRKKLRALPCPYAEEYTNQEYRAFFELNSSDDLSCRTPLGYYFSDVAVSFFQTYSPTER